MFLRALMVRNRRARRASRAFVMDSSRSITCLEHRALTAPAFYRATPYANYGDVASVAYGGVYDQTAVVWNNDNEYNAGDDASNTDSDVTGNFAYEDPADPTSTPTCTIEESGVVTTAVAAPYASSGSNTQEIQIIVSQLNVDTVTASSTGGPYYPTDSNAYEVTSSGTEPYKPLSWNLADTGEGSLSGTLTVSFSISVHNLNAPRFTNNLDFNLNSNLVNISLSHDGGVNSGITVTDSSGTTTLASDSNFSSGSDNNFDFTETVPIQGSVSLTYGSQLESWPSGGFSNETVSNSSSVDWNFTITANPS